MGARILLLRVVMYERVAGFVEEWKAQSRISLGIRVQTVGGLEWPLQHSWKEYIKCDV